MSDLSKASGTHVSLQEFRTTFGQRAIDRGASVQAVSRCMASRAYYAAFCHARNYARDKQGFQPWNTAEDHGRVREHFFRKRQYGIADDLDKLRIWRNMCDYEDSVGNLKVLVPQAVAKAQKVLQKLP